jgi:hypothetical protein
MCAKRRARTTSQRPVSATSSPTALETETHLSCESYPRVYRIVDPEHHDQTCAQRDKQGPHLNDLSVLPPVLQHWTQKLISLEKAILVFTFGFLPQETLQ